MSTFLQSGFRRYEHSFAIPDMPRPPVRVQFRVCDSLFAQLLSC
jgi:hypothetical protein